MLKNNNKKGGEKNGEGSKMPKGGTNWGQLIVIAIFIVILVMVATNNPISVEVISKDKYTPSDFNVTILVKNNTNQIVNNVQIKFYSQYGSLSCDSTVSISPNKTFIYNCPTEEGSYILAHGVQSATIKVVTPNAPTYSKTITFEVTS